MLANLRLRKKIEDGQMCQKDTIKSRVKVKKKGLKVNGVETMLSRTLQRKVREERNKCPSSASTLKVTKKRRTSTVLSSSLATSCQMKIRYFLHPNGYWYLASSSTLEHTGHPPLPPSSVSLSSSLLGTEKMEFYYSLYDSGVAPGHASDVMTSMCGKGTNGTFLPKTILNMNAKTKRMRDLSQGITSDMSDAEKTLVYLENERINHFVVYHDYNSGLFAYHRKGRPTTSERKIRLGCPEVLSAKIKKIRDDLSMDNGNQIILLVSIATDEMVRLVTMYPEKWFLDCTGRTNLQMRDLFIMAIRTPGGKTFPGNMTIVPSGQVWVFASIYKHAFICLYGEVTVSRCRLVLTDEDFSQFHPLENLINTNTTFKDIKVMLCIFHAVWGPFRKEVFPHLGKQANDSGLLTEKGRIWGE